ncbi:High affinity phosphate ABC transporter substrate-binding lipoprotein PstS [Pontimonas salivibrio]|uniref:Phosphate-binding protein n=1 Tax=Pontimonas salivibrio TaxID=1159327 RepID=A0A2L2BNM9_9MICO|nr:PstS family phosphate ABC transporter substrate-binding protein [Pontimonas salivibrio]AVG23273.1 High affinity phosphate ABC transporter substrate-binding lipoprotein PstS [Pontimonas salivibrio]
MKKHLIAPVAALSAGLLLLSACATEAEEPAPAATEAAEETTEETTEAAPELSGTVLLDGSSTVGPFAEVAAELFNEETGVNVTVGISGTGGGFEKFCNGETDGSNASRGIKDEEKALCEENGIEFGQITVANDALSVVVNQDNPLQCITTEQLSAMWNADSTVATWGEVDGLDAGDLAGEELVLYGPGTDSGTFDFFTEEINGESGNIRTDYNNIGEDDNQAVQGVSGGTGAMAFIPYSFYQENLDQVKGLAIDSGDGCVEPTVENLLAGEYTPLGRGLYMFPASSALERPEVLAFYEYVINNNDEIASLAGLVALTDDQKAEQLDVVANLG